MESELGWWTLALALTFSVTFLGRFLVVLGYPPQSGFSLALG